MNLAYSLTVQDYYKRRGHWPDVLFVDPTCVHHIAFELALLANYYPDLPSMKIMFDKRIPGGFSLPCTFAEMLKVDAELDLHVERYQASFHPEARN